MRTVNRPTKVSNGLALTAFTATGANDPAFYAMVDLLTDGIDNSLSIGSQGSADSQYFRNVPGGNGIDLQGFEIVAITERLDSYTYTHPGSDPNHNGQWTDVPGQRPSTLPPIAPPTGGPNTQG